MSLDPEALARLRAVVTKYQSDLQFNPEFQDVEADLRALLAAYAAMEKERDEALAAGRTVVEAADEMRQQWAEIEEDMTNERDTARAEGVAAERARVVADLRRQAENWERRADEAEDKLANDIAEAVSIYLNRNADRYERGEHDKEETIPAVLIFGFPPVNP